MSFSMVFYFINCIIVGKSRHIKMNSIIANKRELLHHVHLSKRNQLLVREPEQSSDNPNLHLVQVTGTLFRKQSEAV
jgi:hypothetical protein